MDPTFTHRVSSLPSATFAKYKHQRTSTLASSFLTAVTINAVNMEENAEDWMVHQASEHNKMVVCRA